MHAHQIKTTPPVRRPPVPNGRRRAWVAVPFALGVLALAAACTPYGTSTAASSASVPAPPAAGTLIAPASTGLGTILVNAEGRTVYDIANDAGGMSTCNGACARTWLPVAAPGVLPGLLPGVPAQVGSTQRSDGTQQLTVAGHPVYTFVGDEAPGQTNGDGIRLNGGLWSVVSPMGSSLAAAGPTSSGTGY
jgi:predicted lipoprotein with Yx(FWY)xxD motif